MTTTSAGTPGLAAHCGRYTPTHYMRRVARSIVLRAALSGRMSWLVAMPLLDKIGGAA